MSDSSKTPTWNREWQSYMVKAVFKDDPENKEPWPVVDPSDIRAHREKILPGWEAHIYKLPNPLAISEGIDEIFVVKRSGKTARIYPPLALNPVENAAGAFKDVKIPEGSGSVETWTEIAPSAVRGLNVESKFADDVRYNHGLRFDIENGFPEIECLRQLLDHVAQYTLQWWLRTPLSPFSSPLSLGCAIDRNFRTTRELLFHGAGNVESTWHGFRQTQMPLGFEKPLNRQVWRSVMQSVQTGIPAETGLLSFADAIAAYMAGDDNRCILDLAICFEILESKRQQADKGKSESTNKKLLKKSVLAEGHVAETMKKLIIDRDHVAHGRPPYLASRTPALLSSYLEATHAVVSKYLSLVQPGEWTTLVNLGLTSTKRRN